MGETNEIVPRDRTKGILTKQSEGQSSQRPRHGVSLRRALENSPLAVAQIVSLPTVAGIVAFTHGATFWHQVASGGPMAWLGAVVLATYGLSASTAVTAIKEVLRSSERDQRSETSLQKIEALISTLQNIDQRWGRRFNRVEDRIDQVSDEVVKSRVLNRQSVPRPNTADSWANYAPGSVAYNINGEARFDVVSHRQPDGSVKQTPDYKRLSNWVVRFGRKTGVSEAHFVLYTDDGATKSPAVVEPQIARHLTAFRAVKKLATLMGADLALENVKFYIRHRSLGRPVKSFFIGEMTIGSRTVPFVQYYEANATMFDVPRTMLDDEVHTCYASDKIRDYKHLAEVLIADQTRHSLEDLERQFGHLVPDPEFDAASVAAMIGISTPACGKQNHDEDDVVHDYGDHFVFRRR